MRVDSIIQLGTDELTREQWTKLLRQLTFLDREQIEVQAYDLIAPKAVVQVPRGAWNLLPSGLHCQDLRSLPTAPELHFTKQLDAPDYEGQSDAVQAMFEHEQGQVIAPPGRGKTEICLAFAAAAKTRTLVVVHTKDLFKQWCDRVEQSVPDAVLGKIAGPECQVGQITIAMAQTLRSYIRKGRAFWGQFGCLVIDEAHHAAAETWSWICHVCPAFYRFGVTASKKRSDGRQLLTKFNIGPYIYEAPFKSQVPMRVQPIESGFRSRYNGSRWVYLIRQLVNDKSRNDLIAKLTLAEIRRGNSVLVLSRQIKHLGLIHERIVGDEPELQDVCKVVTGQLPRRQRDELIQDLRDGSLRCILGTQLFEEGVDIPRLNRIVLAFPGTDVTVLQKVGRGARKAPGKTETIIYDIIDEHVLTLARQWLGRRTWYRSVGIEVSKPTEGVPSGKSKGKGSEGNGAADQGAQGRILRGRFTVARPHRS